ncbi:endo-1,4-beta-xylanase A precursor [Anaerotignum neopropionicum]|uniref:Endo-1,4-beta-xylanase A n=1 Tax=Anaerotignum neopropionicum TaxID=36847 RepID=A0A136WAY2_9FIRM|nr:S-layer homology domain-containing protein [Anaerotignum neopropionicum]KXL51673.1 endo-1,4-beta-xylanase A precursor [Anaerotignum neopropionicum]
MKSITKNKKKALSMALVASMAIAPVNAFAASSDVRGHWAEKTITDWQDKGLISGYQDGTFKPDKATTRAEFARIMNQALSLNNKGSVAFSDVSANDWFYNDVAIALGEAYTAGYPDGAFKPNETITRAQAAVFIANAIGATSGSVAAFTDSASIPSWAKDSVGAIVAKGYMSGYPDGTFKPNAVLTRAEAVSTLNRIMGTANEDTTVTEKDVVIDVDDTKLENQTVAGNVIISEKVGDGEVYLNNVVIEGDLIIQGGGDDSIYLNGTTVKGKTVLDKKAVRLQVSGKTKLAKVEIKKACNLNASSFTGEVGTITIMGDISDKTTIGVPADKLYVDGKANLLISKEIGEVVIEKDASGTKLELGSDAKVSTLTADGKVALSGKGKISTLEANVDDITYSSSLTISKTVTASGVEAPTKTTANSSGSSSSTIDDSSSKKKSISVSNAAELKTAIEDNKYSTINVKANITGDVVATCAGSRSFTINFGTYNIDGNLSITAPSVTAIVLKDTGEASDGAEISGDLTINAPNAEVTSSVAVNGTIFVEAVKYGTLNQTDLVTAIQINGRGAVNVVPTSPLFTAPPIAVNTNEPVRIAGIVGAVTVADLNADVTIRATEVGTIWGQSTGQSLTVATTAPVALAGTFGQVAVTTAGADVTVGSTVSGILVSGAGSTITASVTIPQIQTSGNITIAGTETVGVVDVTANNVAVTVNGEATVTAVTAVSGITGTTIDGDTTAIDGKPATVTTKAVAPTNLSATRPTTPANDDGTITGVTTAMEYRLKGATDFITVTDTTIVDLSAGTYEVRVAADVDVLASDIVEVVIPAPYADSLTVNTVVAGATTGTTVVTINETATAGNSLVYKVGASEVTGATVADTVEDGTAFVSGTTEIPVTANQYVTVYEINSTTKKVVSYISRQITAGEIKVLSITNVTVSGNAKVGETLTLSVTMSDGASAGDRVEYFVVVMDELNSTHGIDIIIDETSNSFAIPATYALIGGGTASIVGKYIDFGARLTGNQSGGIATTRVGPIEAADVAVGVTSATITGTAKVGETLTAEANSDATSATYQWQACDTVGGTYENITDATNSTLVLTAAQEGKFIKVVISGVNSSTATSAATAAVEAEETLSITSVTVSGNPKVGETLTLSVTMSDGDPAGDRVEYFAAVQEASNSTSALGGINVNSNTLIIPAEFDLALGGKESIVGKFIDFGVRLSGVANSGISAEIVGPIVAADVAKETPVENEAVSATAVDAGQTLADSTLSGTFKNADNEAVLGTLDWDAPTTEVTTTGDFAWTFTPTDTTAYNVVTGTVSVTANVVKETPVENEAVSATAVNAGQTLADSTLSGTFKNADNEAVLGTLDWDAPTTEVTTTGDFAWTFTPTDTTAYNVVTGTVSVTANVVKETPVENEAVSATAVNAGQTLADSTLSGTFKNADNEAVLGTLDWDAPTTEVTTTGDFAWTFTPTDTTAYNVVTGTVSVTAN